MTFPSPKQLRQIVKIQKRAKVIRKEFRDRDAVNDFMFAQKEKYGSFAASWEEKEGKIILYYNDVFGIE